MMMMMMSCLTLMGAKELRLEPGLIAPEAIEGVTSRMTLRTRLSQAAAWARRRLGDDDAVVVSRTIDVD